MKYENERCEYSKAVYHLSAHDNPNETTVTSSTVFPTLSAIYYVTTNFMRVGFKNLIWYVESSQHIDKFYFLYFSTIDLHPLYKEEWFHTHCV